ncbi:Putative amidoligase enzyme (plasmid) [Streptomyces sp. YIM 121038]|uniref:amidoligase family protein n=1 Tax=Streptomyces sp. YIM 121038 TaxID=2136401 RepID=UPI00111053A9|nr:amidoligase family protein [Streptomyces sp. YIM 121038]QCX82186.1 Putative amidoligase enzyme [Streptomyces sp. YIM 121038]
MGSGTRIDHQHHLVATTQGLTIEAPADEVVLMPEAQREIIDRALEIQAQWDDNHGQATLDEAMEYSGLRDRLRHEYDLWNGHGLIQEAEREEAEAQPPGFPPRASEPPVSIPVQRAAAQQVLDEVLEEHQAAAALAVQARDRWPDNPEVSFVQDFEAFREIHDAAWNRELEGEEAVPYMLENATGGLGTRESGRGFGLELEFVTDGDWDDQGEALRAIARDLHEAGLAQDNYMYGYHSQRNAGYTDAANAWRLEEDCTVAGEIVSPILYDEPQTWQNLATVCEIIRRHGGGAGEQTGGHVHVGLHDYDHDVANHQRLMDLYADHEDVLFRLAANRNAPDSEHRGFEWCEPNYVQAEGYRALGDVHARARHGMALNLTAARGQRSDHGEFRLWDGSIDPAVIQAQVNVSLGMAAAAVREDPATPRHRRRLGHHIDYWGTQRPPDAQLEVSSLAFREFADEILRGRQQMAQAASLYALTRWQESGW